MLIFKVGVLGIHFQISSFIQGNVGNYSAPNMHSNSRRKGSPSFFKDELVTMVEASGLMKTLGNSTHFKLLLGILPPSVFRNHRNLLIHELDWGQQKDMIVEVFQQKIEYHMQHIVIANFFGPKIPTHHIFDWVVIMNAFVKIKAINYETDIVHAFMYLDFTSLEGTKKLLMLTHTRHHRG